MTATLRLDAAQVSQLRVCSRSMQLQKAARESAALLDAVDELLSGRGWEAEDRRSTDLAFLLAEEAVDRIRVVLEAGAGGDGDAGGQEQPESGDGVSGDAR